MHSPLESLEGTFEHAIFTTYSINLHFFERFVLPMLRRAGARNVIVFADQEQLGSALGPRGLQSLGRSYHAVSVRLGPGAFHPKLIYLRGESGTRACVSSANLTVDGQLRNVESAIVLDESDARHVPPLADLEAFVRRLAEMVPVPAAEAVHAALPKRRDEPLEPPSCRVIHNLDRPLIETFPERGDLTVVTPFVDAGQAASALAMRGSLRVATDGARFAAPASFFSGGWTVTGYDFGERRLHGKAYWSSESRWLLVGSPNLSLQALLRPAHSGNTEVAVLLSPTDQLLDLPSPVPWEGESLESAAPIRQLRQRQGDGTETSAASSFNAWEEDELIRVDIPDGAELEYWFDDGWHDLGRVDGGAVFRPEGVRPYLIRLALAPLRQAIVHRPAALRRHRLGPRTSSRSADVVATLPLDLEGVRVLEGVLTDLYALSALSNERVAELKQAREAGLRESDQEDLTEWIPAHVDDEPRVPELYRKAWKRAPDALLALIRGALRLDYERPELDERDLLEELIEVDELDEGLHVDDPPPPPIPPVGKDVLLKYRSSLMRLLGRGVAFMERCEDSALADLGFQVVLKLHERLAAQHVDVDGEEVLLVERAALLHQKLELLSAYLSTRSGRDPQCLASARLHLAECLAARDAWEPMDRERLVALAHATAKDILAVDKEAARRAADDAGVPLDEATARLKPYADRADWSGFFEFADQMLDRVDFDEEPFPWVAGRDWFMSLDVSPVWRLAGYGAIVGFETETSYGVVAVNSAPASAYQVHALFVDPVHQVVTEGALRRTDERWLVRDYRPVWASVADGLFRLGIEALVDCQRSLLNDYSVDELVSPFSDLVHAGLASARS